MLLEWFDISGAFNAARWVALSNWSPWVLLALALLSVGVLVLGWLNTADLISVRRRTLVTLRMLTLALIWVLLIQPGVRLENVSRIRNHIVFLMDASRSMSLPATDDKSRWQEAMAMLDENQGVMEDWRKEHQIDFHIFDGSARSTTNLAEQEASGEATRIVAALENVATRYPPDRLAAVVLVGDGADNGALGRLGTGTLDPGTQLLIKRLDAPIHTLLTGPSKAAPDIAITDLAYDDFAFVRNAVSIEVEVTVKGYTRLVLPVTLREGDREVGVKTLRTLPGQDRYRFEFEFVPDEVGKRIFTLELGAGPDEEVLINNHRRFVIRIIRDKIRVLQVVGRPSWDERFMRKLLKKNPNVDLISFFILRTPESIEVASRDELSLIPFPTQELFEDQLGSFDLVIFQNFTYQGYRMRRYLPLIRDYVRNGGGFVMVGGDLSFASGGYAGTAMGEFLPVLLPQDRTELYSVERYKPVLEKAGLYHPITMLGLSPEETTRLWDELPPLSGLNRTDGLSPGSVALLTHPNQRSGESSAPVAAVKTFGEGRVLALMTPSSWHWDFLALGAGGDNRHYYKFWGNAIRWLIRDEALKPLQLEADRDRYPLGKEVTLLTKVMGRDYIPSADVTTRVEVSRVDDHQETEHSSNYPTLESKTDQAGNAIMRFKPPEDGAWRVRATAEGLDGVVDEEFFVVETDPVELRETAPNPSLLSRLSDASGGEARVSSAGLRGLSRKTPAVLKVNRRKDVPVWSSAWLLILSVLFPSVEWYLRRRWGLL